MCVCYQFYLSCYMVVAAAVIFTCFTQIALQSAKSHGTLES